MLLKSGIVLYRCFWRVLTSVLCMVMHILCINTLKLLSGFFWDKVWFFLVKTGWQPCVQCSTLYYCRSTAKRVLFWRKINFFPVLQFRSTFVNYLWHKSRGKSSNCSGYQYTFAQIFWNHAHLSTHGASFQRILFRFSTSFDRFLTKNNCVWAIAPHSPPCTVITIAPSED